MTRHPGEWAHLISRELPRQRQRRPVDLAAVGGSAGRSFNVNSNNLEDARIGVALSGGGLRAAAFAIGALTALLDSGLLSQTKVITSTSGGSLVNGAVACGRIAGRAYGNSEADEVRKRISRIGTMMEETGISPYRSLRWVMALAVEYALFSIFLIVAHPFAYIYYFVGFAVISILTIACYTLSAGRAEDKIESALRGLFSFDSDLPDWCAAKLRTEVVVIQETSFKRDQDRFEYHEFKFKDPTLASLSCLEEQHLFVITDMIAENTVHAGRDGLVWLSGSKLDAADVTLATAVLDSMRFPGYLRPRPLAGPTEGMSARFADGGILDNHALSYFMLGANRSDLDIVLSVVAENEPRPGKGTFRITQLLAALGLIHRRLSGQYAERILESDWPGRFISIRLPPGQSMRTTLAPLGHHRTQSLIEAGRHATLTALESRI